MKSKYIVTIVSFVVFLVVSYYNNKFEVIAFNSFWGEEKFELKVMTWNIRCPIGADNMRQREIADVILKEDADFVQLNEFTLDSCLVIDSLLSRLYPYRNVANAKKKAGDVFYSKYQLFESGKLRKVYNSLYSRLLINKDSNN